MLFTQAEAQRAEWAMMDDQGQNLNLYHFIQQHLFNGQEFTEKRMVGIQTALLEMENAALPLMQRQAGQIEQETDFSRQAIAMSEFEERFDIPYRQFQRQNHPALLQRVLAKMAGGSRFRVERPAALIRNFGVQFLGMGLAVLVLGVVVGLLSIPGILLGGSAALMVVFGIGLLTQAPHLARNLNPEAAIPEAMRAAHFGFKNPELVAQVNKLQLNTLQLLNNPEFKQAMANMQKPGMVLPSEHMQNSAILVVLEHMVKVVESTLRDEVKDKLIQELSRVLGLLNLRLSIDYPKDQNLRCSLTPVAEPMTTMVNDRRIIRIKQQLERNHIRLELSVPEFKQPRQRITGTAA